MFTIEQLVLLVVVLIILGAIAIGIGHYFENWILGLALCTLAIVLTILFGVGLNWYNTSTASGLRYMKDYHSNLSNGIDREIIITSEDGREIFRYEGKVDIETNYNGKYIKFESEDGKRYIIYYGVQDTIQIIEK